MFSVHTFLDAFVPLAWAARYTLLVSGLGIALGLVIFANVAMRAFWGTSVPDAIILVRELMVAAILLPMAAATAAVRAADAAGAFMGLISRGVGRSVGAGRAGGQKLGSGRGRRTWGG